MASNPPAPRAPRPASHDTQAFPAPSPATGSFRAVDGDFQAGGPYRPEGVAGAQGTAAPAARIDADDVWTDPRFSGFAQPATAATAQHPDHTRAPSGHWTSQPAAGHAYGADTGEFSTGQFHTGEFHTGQFSTAEFGAPDFGTGQWDTAQWSADQGGTGQWDTGQWSTGQWDTGQWSTARIPAQSTGGPDGSHGLDDVHGLNHPHDPYDSYDPRDLGDPHGANRANDEDDDRDGFGAPDGSAGYGGREAAGGPVASDEEWNPTADSVRPIHGRHRVMKQRGGLARSSAVLGVGVIAAVGAGGIATAQGGKPPVHIAVPDLSSVTDKLSDAKSIPVVGDLLSDASGGAASSSGSSGTPLTSAGITAADTENGTTDAGEALRERILQQAEQQQEQAADTAQHTAEDAAVKKAAEEAGQEKEKAEKKAAEEKKKAEAAAKAKAEAERLAKLAKSFSLPVSSYTLTSHFGDPGAMWSSGYHTGLDFAAPTGTPIKAVHSATVKEAGWSGAYGYRTVLELDDGTELWYCHQSSIGVSVGQKVTTGQVVGRVGATGNVTGPHLHLEVHIAGGDSSDPLAWLRGKGLQP